MFDHIPPSPSGRPYRNEYRVAEELLQDTGHGRVPEAVRTAVLTALRVLYAEAHDQGRPYARGVVDAWRLEFHRDPDGGMFGQYVLAVDGRVSERRTLVTRERMEQDIAALLAGVIPDREGED